MCIAGTWGFVMWATSEMPQAVKRPSASAAPATCARATGASTPQTWLTFTPTFSNTEPRMRRASPPPSRRWPSGFLQARASKRLVGSKASNAAQKRACRSRKYWLAVAANVATPDSPCGVALGMLMHEIHEACHGVRIGIRPDAVPQVEDVSRGAAGLGEHRGRGAGELRGWREQRGGIEVALHRLAGSEHRSHVRERRAPVDADDVHVEPGDLAHEGAPLVHIIDEWHAEGPERRERAPHGREREARVLAHAEQARPRLEQHQRLRAGRGLRGEIGRHGVREERQQPPGILRLSVEKGARRRELLRRPAAHEITEERERRAGKTDERHGTREAPAHLADRLEHEGHVARGLESGERGDLRRG